MSHTTSASETNAAAEPVTSSPRRRPAPGQRRLQILQTLAQLLQEPGAERVTTAALARQLQVSEAALYRHFASKAQMFEGLIDFIELSVFTLVQQIQQQQGDGEHEGARSAARIVAVVAQFAEANPGLARVMVGDALVLEHVRLNERMERFFGKVEAQLRQCLRPQADTTSVVAPAAEAQLRAALLVDLLRGRLQRWVRSGLHERPTRQLMEALALVL
ncbi:nucleoid occlusion factor SlmA [Comamonas faecalis]|uniref:nucleoid occlusion factor SlmA n=1 Tax=Comamonas faecalis TaxID=1387849 RepID=UPI0031E923D3